jgi:Putative polyhydroxyalkanoic acid system protein (PHA_gran_rgn)
MRIAVPHNTTREIARRKVDARLTQLLSQFSGHAEDITHQWSGDIMSFKGKARGFAVEGTVEITDAAMILDAKLPLMAKMFEGSIRQTVEREAERMFRTA